MGDGSQARSSRHRLLALVVAAGVVAAIAVVAVLSLGGGQPTAPSAGGTASHPSDRHSGRNGSQSHQPVQGNPSPQKLAEMLGQMIVARFPGLQPPPSFLARIRAGQIGGVILFSDNLAAGLGAAKALTEELQRAAQAGHQPALLIMTDQEGGEVKRLVGPPTLAPADMTPAGVA